jgi:hypothetical protein
MRCGLFQCRAMKATGLGFALAHLVVAAAISGTSKPPGSLKTWR